MTSFCIASHKANHKLALVLPFNLFFSLLQELWNKRSNCVYNFLSDFKSVYYHSTGADPGPGKAHKQAKL